MRVDQLSSLLHSGVVDGVLDHRLSYVPTTKAQNSLPSGSAMIVHSFPPGRSSTIDAPRSIRRAIPAASPRLTSMWIRTFPTLGSGTRLSQRVGSDASGGSTQTLGSVSGVRPSAAS